MRERILIIDDEPEFRDTLSEILVGAGYRVETSTYLATCIGAGTTGSYDLVTLDLRMPHISGLDVARLLRDLAPLTRVLVISGYLTRDIREQLRQTGVRHTLEKPSGMCEVLEAVRQALADEALPDPGSGAGQSSASMGPLSACPPRSGHPGPKALD